MNGNNSHQPTKKQEITQYINQKQSIEYQATIKRQSSFFSRWKDRRALIIYIPHDQFSLTLINKKQHKTDQIINLHLTKVSKRCSIVQQHYCFGLELKSGKRYLLGGANQAQVLAAFNIVTKIKKILKQKSHISNISVEKQGSNKKDRNQQLEFQKSNNQDDQRSYQIKEQQNNKMVSTTSSPLSKNYQRQFLKEQENRQKIDIQMQREQDYCTVLQEEPIAIQQEQKTPLHLKIPLEQQQLQCLQTDQNFKLFENFSEGRILQKNKQIIKANLVFKTHLSAQQLLESFFHLELWNQKVKKYQLKNRIDQGIYLIELELNKKSFFSSVRHCFMMVTTLTINKEHYLIMKSLQKNTFQQKKGTQWLDLSIWLKVRGEDKHKMNKFVSLCAAVQYQNDFQQVLAFFLQIKFFQSFLLTTNKLPTRVLQWRKQQLKQQFIM